MSNIMRAHHEWANRPADERFTTVEDMHAAALAHRARAAERESVKLSTLNAVNVDGDVRLVGSGGVPVGLTYWSFGQLCARAEAPASYLRTLPADLAVANLQNGLQRRTTEDPSACANLLFELGDDGRVSTARAITGERYARFWNCEVTERLIGLQSRGFEVARPDINGDDGRRPLYVSSHDMFAFMRSDRVISEPGNHEGLRRGIIVSNSEVGAASLRVMFFLYRVMCANHIIWDASNISEVSLRHVGDIHGKTSAFYGKLTQWLNAPTGETEARIVALKDRYIGSTKDEVLDVVFGKRIAGLSRKVLDVAYDATIADLDGSPKTAWGLAQGLTRHSQTIPYADDRTALDRAAGKLLAAF